MTDAETIEFLKSEIAFLKEELKGFHAVINLEMRNTTKHIVYIYDLLSVLDDRITPIEGKFFPNVIEAREQFRLIMQDAKRETGADSDDKKS